MQVEVGQNLDDTGALEEFTWDLFPLVDASETLHLDESGLPKIGTHIESGMIIVGKIAKTTAFDPEFQPTALEIHGLERQALCAKYGGMWRDTSFYASEEQAGVVIGASIEERDGVMVAIVLIEKDGFRIPHRANQDRHCAVATLGGQPVGGQPGQGPTRGPTRT